MKFRELGKTTINSSILGLGCMRLPIVEGKAHQIDEEKAIELIRYAIDHEVTYIDTAYPYHGGNSETIVGKALKDGYRERVTLITKSPSWLIEQPSDFEKYLDEQLEKLQVSCLDIYLLHALDKKRWENYKKIDIFNEIDKMKAKGKIKHIGFSFHDGYETFEEIIKAYNWDVCMIQFNYMDINEQAGLKGVQLASDLGIPMVVMEPLKGGMLATPSDDILDLWQESPRKWSPVEWSLRYIANFENVKVVLSGMSNLDQLKENLEIADRLEASSLSEEDHAMISKVREAYNKKVQIPCTDCKYCVPCPHGVEIPRVFALYNRGNMFNNFEGANSSYQAFLAPEAKASNCVACGECEPKCPQQIQIIERLKTAKAYFGN